MLRLSLLLGATACGAIGVAVEEWRVGLGFVAAMLTSLAVVVTSWSELIGFRLNHDLYVDSRAALGLLRPGRPSRESSKEDVREYVASAENILLGEVGAWGEKWRQRDAEAEEEDG